jgi:hypothetical protein
MACCASARGATRRLPAPPVQVQILVPQPAFQFSRRVMVVPNGTVPGMAVWRQRIFAAMHLNAHLPATPPSSS